MDINKTIDFYKNYHQVCDCLYCRNYLKAIVNYKDLELFFNNYGIDINKPVEIIDYSWYDNKRFVEAYYPVIGKYHGENININGYSINICNKDDLFEVDIKDDYFLLKLSIKIDWLMDEIID